MVHLVVDYHAGLLEVHGAEGLVHTVRFIAGGVGGLRPVACKRRGTSPCPLSAPLHPREVNG